ncbi:hypothetical protein C3L33_06117, partial [Rhododendron williamsianum]
SKKPGKKRKRYKTVEKNRTRTSGCGKHGENRERQDTDHGNLRHGRLANPSVSSSSSTPSSSLSSPFSSSSTSPQSAPPSPSSSRPPPPDLTPASPAPSPPSASSSLPPTSSDAGIEGVQEYVTCREGDVRRLPFTDNYFDVVVSAVFLHMVGKEFGGKTAAVAAERMRRLGEVVRVLMLGG